MEKRLIPVNMYDNHNNGTMVHSDGGGRPDLEILFGKKGSISG